jgi:tetratricopeptide (TPR) repeat protein
MDTRATPLNCAVFVGRARKTRFFSLGGKIHIQRRCRADVKAGMSHLRRIFFSLALIFSVSLSGQEEHIHTAPEKLGTVSFPISCAPAVQQQFNRGVALLHSFAYNAAGNAFRSVAEQDPQCAIAHWGVAMTHFHQLWDPPLSPATVSIAQEEIQQARAIGSGSERERKFINALGLVCEGDPTVPYATRALKYERAMSDLATEDKNDTEAQVFYALALLSNASPMDKSHVKQKRAADILEPLYRVHPQHPGIPHYLIHAYDNAELASRGLTAARVYSKIAPSAPHALHMPSHIFTRLGLWEDSIASNLAAREAARRQGDTGEELHAMDYLVYAYLQSGRDKEAARVVQEVKDAFRVNIGNFKVGYASTAMPVRYAVERGQWAEAASIVSPERAPPQVVAIAVWARGLGLARSGRAAEARVEIDKLRQLENQLRASGIDYWATQVRILRLEVMAWSAQADGKGEESVGLMRQAADEEDAIEKLPVTPGPIIPAREQLGYLLLEQNQPGRAKKEFETALVYAPGRRGASRGASLAAEHSHLQ